MPPGFPVCGPIGRFGRFFVGPFRLDALYTIHLEKGRHLKCQIRAMREEEPPLLVVFLREAICLPHGYPEPLPRGGFFRPQTLRCPSYLWDATRMVEMGQRVVGAIYYVGHIDEQAPLLCVALYQNYRGKGISTAHAGTCSGQRRCKCILGRQQTKSCRSPIQTHRFSNHQRRRRRSGVADGLFSSPFYLSFLASST